VIGELQKLKQLSEADRKAMLIEPEQWSSFNAERLGETVRVGLDGVGVELGASWEVEYMRREPKDRDR